MKNFRIFENIQVSACLLSLLASTVASLAADIASGELPPAAKHQVDFSTELQPLFAERCYDCHGEKKQESGFRADSRAAMLKGGDNGPAFIVGKSAESILVQVLADTHADIAAMPKKKEKFTQEQIGLVRACRRSSSASPASPSTTA